MRKYWCRITPRDSRSCSRGNVDPSWIKIDHTFKIEVSKSNNNSRDVCQQDTNSEHFTEFTVIQDRDLIDPLTVNADWTVTDHRNGSC